MHIIPAQVIYNPLKERQTLYIIPQSEGISLPSRLRRIEIPLRLRNGEAVFTNIHTNIDIVGFFNKDIMPFYFPDVQQPLISDHYLVINYGGQHYAFELQDGFALIQLKDPYFTETDMKHYYKVYETPHKSHSITARIVSRLIRDSLYALTQDDDLLKYHLEDKQNIGDFFADLNDKKLATYKEKLSKDIPKINNVERLKLAFFDPQAGSGNILDVMKDYGIPAVLLGSEIRELSVSKDGYYVATGMPFEFFYDMLVRKNIIKPADSVSRYKIERNKDYYKNTAINSEDLAITLTSMFHFYNPPYTEDMYHIVKTLGDVFVDTLRTRSASMISPVILGLFSTRHEEIIEQSINAIGISIPTGIVGYKGDNMPSNFLYVVGGIMRSGTKTLSVMNTGFGRYGLGGREELPLSVYREFESAAVRHILDNVTPKELINMVVYQTLYAEQLGQILVKEAEEEKAKLRQAIEQLPVNVIFKPYSITSQAIRKEPVFPDLKSVIDGQVNLVTFDDVYADIELQTMYKESYPALYDTFVETCKILGKEIPQYNSEENDYIISTADNLGLLKFKYIKSRLEIDDELYKIIADNLSEEGRKKFQIIYKYAKAVKEPLYLSVKSIMNIDKTGASNDVSSIAVLTVSDSSSVDMMILNIPVEKIYDQIGLNTSQHITEHPEYRNTYIELVYKATADLINTFTEDDRQFLLNLMEEYTKKYASITSDPSHWNILDDIATDYRVKLIQEGRDYLNLIFNLKIDKKEIIDSVLTGKDKKKKVSAVMPVLDKIEEMFMRYPLQFSIALLEDQSVLDNKDTADNSRHRAKIYDITKGKSVKLFFIDEMRKTNALNEEEIQALADAMVEHVSAMKDIVKENAIALRRYLFAFFISQTIAGALQSRDYDRAINLFEELYYKNQNGFGLREYQYKEAVYGTIKARLLGKPGHFLGWEMRAGKTLTMATAGYFASLLNNTKTNFFVKSNNMFDITRQIARHLPHVAKQTLLFPTSGEEFNQQVVSFVYSDVSFINPFAFPSMFRGAGDTVKRLIDENSLANIERYARETFNIEKAIEEIPQLRLLAKIEGVNQDYLKAVVRYLYEHRDLIQFDSKGFMDYLDAYQRLAEVNKSYTEGKEKLKIVSKDKYSLAFSYLIKRDKKVLKPPKNKSSKSAKTTMVTNANVSLQHAIRGAIRGKIEEQLNQYVLIKEEELAKLNIFDVDIIEFARDPVGQNRWFLISTDDYYRSIDVMSELNIDIEKRQLGNFISRRIVAASDNSVSLDEIMLMDGLYDIDSSKEGIYEFHLPAIVPVLGAIPDATDGKMRVNISLRRTSRKTNVSIDEVEYIYDLDKYPHLAIYEGLRSNKSRVLYGFDSINGTNFITDELDTATNIESSTLRFIASVQSPYKLGATGTPTNGDIGDTIGLLGIISGVPIEILERSIHDIRDRYAIREFDGNRYQGLFTLIVRYTKELLERSPKEVLKLYTSKSEDGKQFVKGLIEAASQFGIYTPPEESLIIEEIQRGGMLPSTERAVMSYKRSMRAKLEKINYYSETSLKEIVVKTMVDVLSSSRFGIIKRGVGTTNPMFAKNITDISGVSMKSREMLKGVREQLVVQDDITSELLLYKKNGSTGPVLKAIEAGQGLINDRIRYDYDYSLAASTEIRAIYNVITGFAEILEKSMIASKSVDSDLLSAVTNTGTTTRNGLADIVGYILTDDDALKSISDEKRKVAQDFIEVMKHSKIWLSYSHNLSDELVEEQEGYLRIQIDQEFMEKHADNSIVRAIQSVYRGNYIIESLSTLPVSIVSSLEYIDREIGTLDMANFDRFDIFSPDTYTMQINLMGGISQTHQYWHKLKLVGADDEELISIVTDRGLFESMYELIELQRNFLVPVSRIDAIPVVLAGIMEKCKDVNNTNYYIVVKSNDKRVKKFFDEMSVIPANVKVKLATTNAELEKEISRMKEDDKSVHIVVAGAKSISRGIDLSFFDTMVVAGSMDANAREFTQLLARVYNNDPECISKDLYLYGTSSKFVFWIDKDKQVREHEHLYPSKTLLQKVKLLKTSIFNKQLLQGNTEIMSLSDGNVQLLSKGVEYLAKAKQKGIELAV